MYTFELTKDGYYILQHGQRVYHQYKPLIPFPRPTMQESAMAHINSLLEQDNAMAIRVDALEEMINELLLGGL